MSIFKNILNFASIFALIIFSLASFTASPVVLNAQVKYPTSGDLCKGADCPGGVNTAKVTSSTTNQNAIFKFIITIAQWLTFIAGAVAALFMVIGGYYFISANGDEEKVTKGKQTLIWASIGLATAILAYTIVTLISGFLAGNSLGDFLGSGGGTGGGGGGAPVMPGTPGF